MPDFQNTQVAFAAKSNKELRKAHRLFSLLGKPTLMRLGKAFTLFAFKIGLPIKGIVKKTIFTQFCGGETIGECDRAIASLSASRIGTILDYSVEGKEDDSSFERTTEEILATIKKAAGNDSIPFSVFKVTGIAQFSLLERASSTILSETDQKLMDAVLHRVDRICKAAHESGTPVFIDAEESWIQKAIDDLATTMMLRYNREKPIVWNTFQLYRHDRLEFLKQSTTHAEANDYYLGAKLVRGAYMEKERARAQQMGYPSPIQPDKVATDKDYNHAIAWCVNHADRISFCAGTHNEHSSLLLAKLIREKSLAEGDKRFWFAQLLGMSDHISYNLADSGFNVAKYVPYGPVKEVLPYLMRRAEENTSVAGQTGRELSLIKMELKNRKQRNSGS